jgi:ADP-heptose:LPS heptosyltransferase
VKILVIKHGALGDIVLAFPAFAAIRAAWPGARISLLTTAPFAGFMGLAPWFDMVDADARPEWWNLSGLLKLRRQLRGFDLVYDLQTSGRSSRYFALAGRPEWSGIAKGCSLPHANPRRQTMHTRERLADQLAAAGIADLPAPDLAWADADVSGFRLPKKFAVVVPGAAPHRPAKRWPEEKFAALAPQLRMPVVVLGSAAEAELARPIRNVAPGAIDLAGKTNLAQLAAVIRRAALAVGNDTGPMHMAAAFGVPSVVLFSAESDPALTAPRYQNGDWPKILRAPHLSGLPVAQVVAALP